MNYKDFTLGDWIGHISGVIEDETTLDGNEMRDLVEFLTTLKQEPVFDKDCEHCSKTYGTLGCCDTVSNELVYSCKEGQREYLLGKVSAEIKALSHEPTAYDVVDGNPIKDAVWETLADVLRIIDKYKGESEK